MSGRIKYDVKICSIIKLAKHASYFVMLKSYIKCDVENEGLVILKKIYWNSGLI